MWEIKTKFVVSRKWLKSVIRIQVNEDALMLHCLSERFANIGHLSHIKSYLYKPYFYALFENFVS